MAGTKNKKNKKKAKENTIKELDPCSDPTLLLSSYSQFSKDIGFEPHGDVKKALAETENAQSGEQIIIDGSVHSFGPGGCRALATSLMGKCGGILALEEKRSKIYNKLQEVRIWRDNIGDFGAMAIAEILRLGGAELQLSYLELMDTGIKVCGAIALGRSLSVGMNKSLITLNLDFNTELGDRGIAALCKGLRTNSSLKKLSVKYCNIQGKVGGSSLGEMLSFSKSSLITLNLAGNGLRGIGLSAMCESGLNKNKMLQNLNLSDISIASSTEDMNGIKALASVIVSHPRLSHINLSNNAMNASGASIFVPVLNKNKRISSFVVDSSLPHKLYTTLSRNGTKSTKKKKKVKKKKKK